MFRVGLSQKFFVFSTILIFGSSIFIGQTKVQAQYCGGGQNYTDLQTCLSQCGENPPGTETYTGYYGYRECVSECGSEGLEGADYVNCADQCESRIDDQDYFNCTSGCLTTDNDSGLRECLCNNDESWVKAHPESCEGVLDSGSGGGGSEKGGGDGGVQGFVNNFLPNCTKGAIGNSSENLFRCIRSVINALFLVAILIFFIRITYLAILSAATFGGNSNFYKDMRESIQSLIIGIILVGMPTAIMNIINPSAVDFNLSALTEFNLGSEGGLRSPSLNSSTPTTEQPDQASQDQGENEECGENENCEEDVEAQEEPESTAK